MRLREQFAGTLITGADKSRKINLGESLQGILDASRQRLEGLSKNDFTHSERLEEYLDCLAQMLDQNPLTPGESFVLLCAAYLHDIGYRDGTRENPIGHQERSATILREIWSELGFADFHPKGNDAPPVVEAIALVCHAHSPESEVKLNSLPLMEIQELDKLNLKKLAAMLRIADEADDPFFRIYGYSPTRSNVNCVKVQDRKVVWYWDDTDDSVRTHIKRLRDEKKTTLREARKYLAEHCGAQVDFIVEPDPDRAPAFNVPNVVDEFVGRGEYLEMLEKNLLALKAARRHGFVGYVYAAGGMGKSELAKRFAHDFKREFPDGVYWVSFREGSWRTLAASVLGGQQSFMDDGQAKAEVVNSLKGKDALLILDNFDQLEQAIEVDCYVLVTGREEEVAQKAFGTKLTREAFIKLKGFSIDDARELFYKLCRRQVEESDKEVVDKMLGLMAGMPLAVKIAALAVEDTLPDEPLANLLVKFRDDLDSICLDGMTESDRAFYNVKSCLMMSFESLASDPQRQELEWLFDAAAACPVGGFRSRELLMAAGVQDSALLKRLFKRSLVEYNDKSKSYFLHPLLYKLSEQRLRERNDGSRERATRGHLEYVKELVSANRHKPERIIEEKDALWLSLAQLRQLKIDETEANAFVDLLLTPFGDYMDKSDHVQAFKYLRATNLVNLYQKGFSLKLKDVLEKIEIDKLNTYEQGMLLSGLGIAYIGISKYRDAITLLEKSLAIARLFEARQGRFSSLNNIGTCYLHLGEHENAYKYFKLCIESISFVDEQFGYTGTLANLGLSCIYMGKYDEAIGYLEDSLVKARTIGNEMIEGLSFGNLGIAYIGIHRDKEALDCLMKQVSIADKYGDTSSKIIALGSIGSLFFKSGSFTKALKYYIEKYDLAVKTNDINQQGEALFNMGLVFHALGEIDLALKHLDQAREIFSKLELSFMVERVDKDKKDLGLS